MGYARVEWCNGWYAVDMSGVGVGQTYQNMSSVRVIGTSYPNATGRPIEVSYNGQSGVGGSIYTAVVSGSTISTQRRQKPRTSHIIHRASWRYIRY